MARVRVALPTGTVTFLRTDVEGSMALGRQLGPVWDELNAAHLGLIRDSVARHGGVSVRTEGDALFAAFGEAGAAVRAAVDAQRAVAGHEWPDGATVRARMGLHTGEAHLAGDDYGGFEVNRAARIAASGHGGQILLSEPTWLLAAPGVAPGITARDLGRHILKDVPQPERLYQLDVQGLQSDFPPLRTGSPVPGNLAVRMTSFVGRDKELGELAALLGAQRLVTLTGPGGIGKTSLATELARAQGEAFGDGAWFIALEVVSDPSEVKAAIARTLGLFDAPDRPAGNALPDYIAGRETLLVLDNFEHLLDAAPVVSELLQVSPATKFVISSRAPLGIAGEQEYPVAPLDVVGPSPVAARLFLERARAVRPGWDPGGDARLVEEVCGLVDGLPLGVELAAARIGVLSVGAIHDRLAARLPLPGSGPRAVPERQRTLDGAIGWSYELLEAGEQRVLQDLAVFDGSFELEQAEQVLGPDLGDPADVLEVVAVLVVQNLVSRQAMDDGRAMRFRMLNTIRAFALGRLAQSGREAEVRRRHADAYLQLVEEAARHMPGAGQVVWLTRLGLDHDNLRAAVRWSIACEETELALRLVGSSWRYWQLAGHLREGDDLATAALAMPGANAPTSGRLAAVAAAGGIAYWRSRMDRALEMYSEQFALAEALGDRAAAADATFNMIFVRYITGDFDEAERAIADAAHRYRELGNEVGLARMEWVRATLALYAGDAAAAIPILLSARGLYESTGDVTYLAMTGGNLAWAYWLTGDLRSAAASLVRAVVETRAIGDLAALTITIPAMAIAWLEQGDPEIAALLWGASDAAREKYGVEAPAGLAFLTDRWNPLDRIQAELGPEKFANAIVRGRRMTLDDVSDLIVHLGDSWAEAGSPTAS